MDIKRTRELIHQLDNMVDQIDKDKIDRMTEDLKTEITVKVMAILNELDISPTKYGE